MQVRGTFPELSSGMKKARRGTGQYARPDKGSAGFAVTGPTPRMLPKNPSSYAGRRAASHRKAYGI